MHELARIITNIISVISGKLVHKLAVDCMITTFIRIFKSARTNFRRNIWLSVATVSTFVLSLSMVFGLLMAGYVTDYLVINLQDKADISVYFKIDTSEEDILRIRRDLEARQDVKNIEYISREQAMGAFKEKHKDNPVLMESLEELGENPLQASLNIKAFSASQYQALANLFETVRYKNFIEKINWRQNEIIINKIFDISRSAKTAGLIITLILSGIAGLVAFNTIRLAIYSQKEEISVMRLVGAGNWFIRGPLVIEGMASGFFAAILTMILFFGISLAFSNQVANIFSGLNIFHYFVTNFLNNFLILLAAGVGLGALSSFIAIRRYLNV